jgi:hypothetical protein
MTIVKAGPAAPEAQTAAELRDLVVRISFRDRIAFITLFDTTCARLRERLEWRLGDPAWADEVLVATYVEVWWLSGKHAAADADIVAWMNDIVERRVAEGPPLTPEQDAAAGNLGDLRSRIAQTELAGLLGRPIALVTRPAHVTVPGPRPSSE